MHTGAKCNAKVIARSEFAGFKLLLHLSLHVREMPEMERDFSFMCALIHIQPNL